MKASRTDSTIPELGFAMSCVYSSAICFDEFLEWIYLIIKERDELSTFVYDIPNCNSIAEVNNLIDFIPREHLTNAEGDALYGIAIKRGTDIGRTDPDLAVRSNEAALKALADNPHIEQRFRETFPFIEF